MYSQNNKSLEVILLLCSFSKIKQVFPQSHDTSMLKVSATLSVSSMGCILPSWLYIQFSTAVGFPHNTCVTIALMYHVSCRYAGHRCCSWIGLMTEVSHLKNNIFFSFQGNYFWIPVVLFSWSFKKQPLESLNIRTKSFSFLKL